MSLKLQKMPFSPKMQFFFDFAVMPALQPDKSEETWQQRIGVRRTRHDFDGLIVTASSDLRRVFF